jgi:hypothetical protein
LHLSPEVPVFVATLQFEVGEAGLLAVVECARTGELTPVAFVVLRNLSLHAQRALKEREKQVRASKPAPPTIRELRRAA